MLAGALSEEDEDAVLAELEAITQVSRKLNLYKCRGCIFKHSLHVSALIGLLKQLVPQPVERKPLFHREKASL